MPPHPEEDSRENYLFLKKHLVADSKAEIGEVE